MYGVIFDCDGVLTESESLHFECWKEVFFIEWGFLLPDDNTIFWGLNLKEIIKKTCDLSQKDYDKLPPETMELLLQKKIELFIQKAPIRLKPLPGIELFLQTIKEHNVFCCLMSSARRTRLFSTLSILKLDFKWDLILPYEDINKSDTMVVSKNTTIVTSLTGIPQSNFILFEDNHRIIKEGKANGIGLGIGVISSFNQYLIDRSIPDYLIDSYNSQHWNDLYRNLK